MSYLKQMNMKSYYYLSLMLCALSAGVSAQEITKSTDVESERTLSADSIITQDKQLAYNMPKKWLNALGIKAAKIYGTVENLHTFTDYVGNPDTNSYSTNPMLRGADYNTYPLSRKYIFGVNVTF